MTSLQTPHVDNSDQLLRKSLRIDESNRKRKVDDECVAAESEKSTGGNKGDQENEKLAKKQKLEQEKGLKRAKMEEEKRAKARRIEEEKEAKRKKLEEEKEAKRRKLEQEKLEKEKRKLEEKLEKEKKKELERLEREKKKQAEQAERERKKREEQAEKERKRQAEQEERERKKQAELTKKERKREEREREKLERKLKLEEEKKTKELEKQRIEEEKRKADEAKERSQMKISNFFQVRPQASQTKDETVKTEAEEVRKSEYETEFLPFFVQRNVMLKEYQYCTGETKSELDCIMSGQTPKTCTFDSFLNLKRSKYTPQQSITPEAILNALNLPTTSEQQVLQMVEKLPPIKFISFYENSKPPYTGSWCSQKHQDQQMAIITNPLDKEITGFDYGYDSDLEWDNEEKDGEDIDDDDDEEEDLSMLPDEEDDEFIENDSQSKQNNIHQMVVINKWNNDENREFFSHYTTSHIVDLSKLKSFV
ncbi:RLF2 [Candida margitis]|uniref:RLF2 n=1 Tax=Candida margitis TaxID=1775924 RepID=UPI002226D4A4|nr:RLF2 [Candida margitis]KAI5957397.1 RLF2 [Candida margitis]